MKKRNLLFLSVLSTVLLTGCASSDRMTRMSGGIFDEYSAPPDYRMRSAKFQQKNRFAVSPKRPNSPNLSGIDDSLVNIWPFFFRNKSYWSVLWPLLDYDDFGFAFRPFYVQDGDEYSVLFPLSAWNPENKDGWIANFAWTRTGFGFVPLSWQDSDWCYYTPFFIYRRNRNELTYHFRRRTDSFLEIMLAWRSRKTKVTAGEFEWLYQYFEPSAVGRNAVLKYRFSKMGRPAPADSRELDRIRMEIFRTLPVKSWTSWGFFPFFSCENEPGGKASVQFFPLFRAESGNGGISWNVLGLLADYRKEPIAESLWSTGREEFFSPILLTKVSKRHSYRDAGAVRILRELRGAASSNKPFSQQIPRIEELLKQLDPELKLPAGVSDAQTLGLFLDDWRKGRVFPVEETRSGGFLPLFIYDTSEKSGKYIFPALLSGYGFGEENSTFLSIPLLTYGAKRRNSDFLGVLPPFVYMDKAERAPDSYTKPISGKHAKNAPKNGIIEERNRYFLCGLFYRGKTAFRVAKQDRDGAALEFIRSNLLNLHRRTAANRREEESLKKERQRTAAWKPKNKIEHYRKLIREEELNIQEASLRKKEEERQKLFREVRNKADSIGFRFADNEVLTNESAAAAVGRLFRDYTEVRWKEDAGSGFFFRKENFYNGDYEWRLLGFLASGEKTGTKESANVLHLLYRHRREENRSETLFFPFVSIQRDGEDSRFSFLWRVFQLERRKGKTGGYFMFVPF